DDLGERQAAAADPADEVPEHLCRHVEVGDHTVPERTDRTDRRRRASDHSPRLFADRVHGIRGLVDRDDGRLEHDDALAANEDERVRRAEVDRQLPTTGETLQSHGPRMDSSGGRYRGSYERTRTTCSIS